MADEIIRELWQIKDSIANEHRRDIEALVAYLRSKPVAEGQSVVDLSAKVVSNTGVLSDRRPLKS